MDPQRLFLNHMAPDDLLAAVRLNRTCKLAFALIKTYL